MNQLNAVLANILTELYLLFQYGITHVLNAAEGKDEGLVEIYIL